MVKLFWSALTATPALLSITILTAMAAFADTQVGAKADESTLLFSPVEVGSVDDPTPSSNSELAQSNVAESLLEAKPELASEQVTTEQSSEKVDNGHRSILDNPTAETPAQALSQTSLLSPQANISQANVSQASPPSDNTDPTGNSVLDQVAQYSDLDRTVSNNPSANSPVVNPILNQVSSYSNQNGSSDPLAQLTSITQLSDVQPTDWAYQALQSLVERYNCIVGYPDGTFKGQRALSRFEFAAGVNACLDRISELIASSTADLATKEDLATLQRLQEEFAAELASLRGRVDELESRTAALEANQFSTTTKLHGDGFFLVADVFGDEVSSQNETVGQYRYRLTLDTSFSGRDILRARLQAGNVLSFIQPGFETTLAANTNTNGDIVLDDLGYYFPINDVVSGLIVANAVSLDRLIFGNTIVPFDLGGRGAISRFGQRPPIYRFGGLSTGGSFNFQFNEVLSAQIGYGAGNGGNPSPSNGLFNGDYNIIGQLTAKNLFDRLDLALTYVNTYIGTAQTSTGITAGLRTGTGSLFAAVDADRPVIANSYGIEANFKVTPGFQLGGWAGFSAVRAIELGDADVWNYAVTLAFPDLGGKGNLGGIVVGQQPRLAGTTEGLGDALGLRSDPNAGLSLEGFYRVVLNDYVDITPGVVWVTAPNNNDDNPDIILGVVRASFRF